MVDCEMPTPFFNAMKFVSFVDELALVHANVFGPNVGVETITFIFFQIHRRSDWDKTDHEPYLINPFFTLDINCEMGRKKLVTFP